MLIKSFVIRKQMKWEYLELIINLKCVFRTKDKNNFIFIFLI